MNNVFGEKIKYIYFDGTTKIIPIGIIFDDPWIKDQLDINRKTVGRVTLPIKRCLLPTPRIFPQPQLCVEVRALHFATSPGRRPSSSALCPSSTLGDLRRAPWIGKYTDSTVNQSNDPIFIYKIINKVQCTFGGLHGEFRASLPYKRQTANGKLSLTLLYRQVIF